MKFLDRTFECRNCIYLGEYTVDNVNDWNYGSSYDLWICTRSLGNSQESSLLGQYGNEPNEYVSYPYLHGSSPDMLREDYTIPNMQGLRKQHGLEREIYLRAIVKGLVKKEIS